MNQKPTITLSEQAHAQAQKRAREGGFESIEAYVDALIEDDRQAERIADWMRLRLEQGLASPTAGEMSESKFQKLIDEGIARVPRQA